jgi:hypothetical protein
LACTNTMKLKSLCLLLIMLAAPVTWIWSQGSEIVRHGIRFEKLDWEFVGGFSFCNNIITALPEDQSYTNFQSESSGGFQFGVHPIFRISRPITLRSGLLFSKREYQFNQKIPWDANYTEKAILLGIPAHFIYTFGYSDVKFNLFSGLQLNYSIKNTLEYSALAVPGYWQEGSINNSFDRKRFIMDFQIGAGLRFQVSKIYIGLDLCYYLEMMNHSRFNTPRTLYIYQDLEPTIPYYSPRFWGHGIMFNLVLQKRRS